MSLLPGLRACSNSPSTCGLTISDAAKALGTGTSPLASFGSPTSQSGNAGSGNSDDSGSGIDSGGSGSYHALGGGLKFPEGGLGGLGLPTRGDAAIDVLKPYAITTQNTLGSAVDLLKGLLSGGGGGISLPGLSGAIDALAAASSGTVLGSQARHRFFC